GREQASDRKRGDCGYDYDPLHTFYLLQTRLRIPTWISAVQKERNKEKDGKTPQLESYPHLLSLFLVFS
ncbi:MAG: hypothetical protein C4294_07440, partial [Nitrospiraceae bacterium]